VQHVCEGRCGTGEARLRSLSSGPGASYKPKAKGKAAQRESEGIVVPEKAVKAAGGKGPCGGGAEGE
jgi:hypothetical protein